MKKIQVFEFKFGSIGWQDRNVTINNFMKDKKVVNVLQSVIGQYVVITVVYRV